VTTFQPLKNLTGAFCITRITPRFTLMNVRHTISGIGKSKACLRQMTEHCICDRLFDGRPAIKEGIVTVTFQKRLKKFREFETLSARRISALSKRIWRR